MILKISHGTQLFSSVVRAAWLRLDRTSFKILLMCMTQPAFKVDLPHPCLLLLAILSSHSSSSLPFLLTLPLWFPFPRPPLKSPTSCSFAIIVLPSILTLQCRTSRATCSALIDIVMRCIPNIPSWLLPFFPPQSLLPPHTNLSWYPVPQTLAPPLTPVLPEWLHCSIPFHRTSNGPRRCSPRKQEPGTATSARGGGDGGGTPASEGGRRGRGDTSCHEQMSPGPKQQAGGAAAGRKRCWGIKTLQAGRRGAQFPPPQTLPPPLLEHPAPAPPSPPLSPPPHFPPPI